MGFLTILKRQLTKVLIKMIDPIAWMQAVNERIISLQELQVCKGTNSNFYSSTQIHNLQQDRTQIVIGDNTHVRGELLIFKHNGKIEIGNFSFIGEGSRVWSANKIAIGSHVLISHGVQISDTNVHETDYKERAKGFEQIVLKGHPSDVNFIENAPIVIEDYVWINFNVSILKGVRIGKGAIIAAGSVVISNVEPFTLVAGNPAKKIKDISHD